MEKTQAQRRRKTRQKGLAAAENQSYKNSWYMVRKVVLSLVNLVIKLSLVLTAYLNKDHVQLPNVHLFFLKGRNKQGINER